MITLRNITKKYKDKTALSDISLDLDCGIYGLLGPNGAGKTTLMNIITGNISPTSGSVLWNGADIQGLGEQFRSIIGYAPQQQGLYPAFSGRRFLAYMAALKGISKKEVKEEIARVLSYVNMEEAADGAVGTYSGGMKQRIREQIRALSSERIILVSTHVVSDIAPIAKEILLIRSGSMIDRGDVEQLCRKYNNSKDLEEVYMHLFGEEERYAETDSL